MEPKTGKDLNYKKKSSDKVKNESDDDEIKLVTDYDSSDEMIKEVEKVVRNNKPKVEKTNDDEGVIKQEVVRNVVTGEAFEKLQKKKKSKKLGATSLGYSNRVNNKYVVDWDSEKIHFGSIKMDDFLIHGDEKKGEKYLERVKKIKNKDDDYTYKIARYANYWNVNLLY